MLKVSGLGAVCTHNEEQALPVFGLGLCSRSLDMKMWLEKHSANMLYLSVMLSCKQTLMTDEIKICFCCSGGSLSKWFGEKPVDPRGPSLLHVLKVMEAE